jgi:hypothetical protein
MLTEGKAFKGRLDTIGPFFPFVAPAPLSESGILLGDCPQTGRLMFFDPPALMKTRQINGMVFQIIAPKNHGKSTLMKSLGTRATANQAGVRNGVPERTRVEVNDRKPEGEDGQGEYAPYGRFVHAKTIELAKIPAINIFKLHPRLENKPRHIHEIAIRLCELDKDAPLNGVERFVLLLAINKMFSEYSEIVSPNVLEFVLATLVDKDLQTYYKERDRKLLNDHADSLRFNPDLKAQIVGVMQQQYAPNGASVQRNASWHEIKDIAGQLSIHVANTQQGQSGGIIGGKTALHELLTAERIVWDWTGVPKKARTILEYIRQDTQELALSHPELKIMPHVRLGDEERSAGNDAIHLQHRLEFVEKARAFRTMDFVSVQFEKGFSTTLGAEGSVERGIADLINQGTGARFFGRQPYDEVILHELSKYGIADHNLFRLTQIEYGEWLVQTGGSREVQWLRHCLIPSELPLIESNSAARGMSDRVSVVEYRDALAKLDYTPPVLNPGEVRRRLVSEGHDLIEPQE